MFTQIKTSKANREVVTQLTHKLGLGKENIIARIAFTHSLSKEKKMDLTRIEDAQGKEYSKTVLFGNNFDIYLGLLCTHYKIYKTDKDIPKYIKMHIDDGLILIKNELIQNSNIDEFRYLTDLIHGKLNLIKSEIN